MSQFAPLAVVPLLLVIAFILTGCEPQSQGGLGYAVICDPDCRDVSR